MKCNFENVAATIEKIHQQIFNMGDNTLNIITNLSPLKEAIKDNKIDINDLNISSLLKYVKEISCDVTSNIITTLSQKELAKYLLKMRLVNKDIKNIIESCADTQAFLLNTIMNPDSFNTIYKTLIVSDPFNNIYKYLQEKRITISDILSFRTPHFDPSIDYWKTINMKCLILGLAPPELLKNQNLMHMIYLLVGKLLPDVVAIPHKAWISESSISVGHHGHIIVQADKEDNNPMPGYPRPFMEFNLPHDYKLDRKYIEKYVYLLPIKNFSEILLQVYKLMPYQKEALFFKSGNPQASKNIIYRESFLFKSDNPFVTTKSLSLETVTDPKFTLFRWNLIKQLGINFDLIKNLNPKELSQLYHTQEPKKLAQQLNKEKNASQQKISFSLTKENPYSIKGKHKEEIGIKVYTGNKSY